MSFLKFCFGETPTLGWRDESLMASGFHVGVTYYFSDFPQKLPTIWYKSDFTLKILLHIQATH